MANRYAGVREHYNTERRRKNDHMLPVRNCHNFAKACLLADAVPRGGRVLDLCCGNGGDLGKMVSAGAGSYVGIDLAEEAVERARERRERLPGASAMACAFHALDAFGAEAADTVRDAGPFDTVSCQFAIHYAFGDEAAARAALGVVAAALREGGRFVGITTDGAKLDLRRKLLGRKFGDRYFAVGFEGDEPRELGDAYEFSLTGAVDKLREYVVRQETFERLAKDAGLALELWQPLDAYVRQQRLGDHGGVWKRMVGDEGARLADVTGLYAAFVCRRREG